MNKKTLVNKLDNRKIKITNRFIYAFARQVCRLLFVKKHKPEYHYHFDKEKMKNKQVIILADHSSYDNFFFVIDGYPFTTINIVMAYHHIFEKALAYIFFILNVIPKKIYEADLRSIRQMKKVISMEGSLLLFPEGTYSFSGTNQPINPSTMNFIKLLGVDVILCKSYGAYCSRPVYAKKSCRGHREYHYELLFSAKELEELNNEEIYNKMLSRLCYNDINWGIENNYSYKLKGGNAKGLQSIIYYCPKCHEEFKLKTNKDEIFCACGNRIKIDNHYKTIPIGDSICSYSNISEWYLDQRKKVQEEIKKR